MPQPPHPSVRPATGPAPATDHLRRRLLGLTAAATALAFTARVPQAAARPLRSAELAENPFTLGVASGDPLPDAVVLWTRLAPRPFEPGNGLPARGVVDVQWEISRDEDFRRTDRRGTTRADAEYNYSVHVDVQGLEPDRVYWYRFRTGRWISPTGRTRTTPPAGAAVRTMRLGLASCQQYDEGYYTALAHLAREDLDAVFFVGDYIYENAINAQAGVRRYTGGRRLPDVFRHETMTLTDYRLRYALGKSDPDLQAAHAAHPWYVTWDDHEVENNYAGEYAQAGDPVDAFLRRRAAAYRAYWENMPLRRSQRPSGPDMRLYRRFEYGNLAQFDILDTRQYRDDQAYGDGWKYPGRESDDPDRSITGDEQEEWLIDGLQTSTARWNVVPQQLAFCQRKSTTGSHAKVSMDAWDGYPASRDRVLSGARDAGVTNLVVLSGDAHVNYAMDIKEDFDDPDSPTVGVEIVGTSLSSGSDGTARPGDTNAVHAANPHLKHYSARRGYVVVTLTHSHLRADFRALPYVTRPGAPVSTLTSLVSEAGEPGFERA
ncbi:alkaline phosphatase [Streptomyces mashuensis]|uniref:Alkaline phosphatase n=1 Tax=Streptomyces mashuensis TaxID=33904 RepID=A0A919EEQ4_9ACTN|nr:alkaline phosphatase D family protein [Streptomyces mashuensis]GHF55616.1 alkaline phosphatase [Streptomyces mashuensis]